MALGAFQWRLTDVLKSSSVLSGEAGFLGYEVRSGAVVEELVRTIGNVNAREALMSEGPALRDAPSKAIALVGVASAVFSPISGLLIMLVARRRS